MKSTALINQLERDINKQMKLVTTHFLPLSIKELNKKPAEDKWSIAECLDHLNLYAAHYIPQMLEKIKGSSSSPDAMFHSSWLGAKSIKTVHPDNMGKPQKTLKHMNPSLSTVAPDALDRFLANQQQLLIILEQAKKVSLTKVKIPIEFFKLLKLRLGDCLQFVVIHQERHLIQARNVDELVN